jgi:ABC-type transport system involved in multi-copper enzyme maturation permease subunit
MLLIDNGGGEWAIKAIASNIPYLNLAFVNSGQAIIAIFLASDFMKRDHKMDTSEVFYVRPLSNAEYILGKIWGNLRVFLIFNLIVMGMSIVFTVVTPHTSIDWAAYPVYFLLISIPTLIYIIGLAVFLMLLFRNQSLTFILLLGYIGLSLFYLKDKYYFMYDYMANFLPMVKSSIVGFTNWDALLTPRMFYLFAGFTFIFMTIVLFRRLPNSPRSNYPWIAFTLLALLISSSATYQYINGIHNEKTTRNLYTSLNNQYVHTPKMVIDQYDISVEQHPAVFNAEAKMKGITLQTAAVFTFCLNPGLNIQEITGENGAVLSFKRDQQIILIDFDKEIAAGDTILFTVKYGGKISKSFCYLDIPDEELQKKYGTNIFSSDKQYAFQTKNFLMFTPETFWYPRPGTAYSNESSDWQQTYFSRYTLKIKPLPGLIPISQGEATENADGTYSFSPEYPVQAISLLAGKYKQQSLIADDIQYNILYIEGHDYYSKTLQILQDTLPSIVRSFKENQERQYKLDYPFKRFSIVETPAQFFAYRHVWSKADESMQPEMLFIPEKGWLKNSFDIEKSTKSRKQFGGNNKEITEEVLKIQSVQNIFGQYSLFPQLYNFRFNIFSPEWPVSNLIIESYLQNIEAKEIMTELPSMFYMRTNGKIGNYEKANILMGKHSFKELLANTEYRNLLEYFIKLRADQLFVPAEINTGTQAFRDSVFSVLKRNTFHNIQFESLLDTLENISRTDIQFQTKAWNKPVSLPFYTIGSPEISQFVNKNREVYVLKIAIGNESDYDGIIRLEIKENRILPIFNPQSNRGIVIQAHQCLQLVSLWDEAPKEIKINTLISGNIPYIITQGLNNINREKEQTFELEGDYIVSNPFLSKPGEIIIDNEDSLFSLSEPIIVGLLPKWMNRKPNDTFNYPGILWFMPPLQWTATINQSHYGQHIRSAYAVKSGNGNKTATWKAPLSSPGNYEVYFYVYKDEESRQNRSDVDYHFKIQNGEETETVSLNLNRAGNGWEQLGVFYFSADTVSVTLTNEYKHGAVYADAVKFVKR